ncbi:MAG: FAD-dependent oxidoreductase [Deltaproteobacteria bacterium]|nr:FAD-dependent oxidoreductase [Candidatus Anaeroferrophillus wilburensis]MBN2889191.1 FAD-dependent oxidoreductase [Deltaproteobacteria bacterium]
MAGNFSYDMGIIGGGAAGLTIAAGSAKLGAKTLLVEKESQLGGDCLHYGCVPSKALIKTAQVYHQMKDVQRYGVPPVVLPEITFSRVAERIRNVQAAIQHHDSPERFCSLGVQVEIGVPEFVDEHEIRLNGKQYTARNWVIATGSAAAVPPLPGLASTPFITNRELFSLEKLPTSMIILGAGPIACEMAQAFNRLGTKVTIIQRSHQILSNEDKDMADGVMAVLAAEGVRFLLETQVQQVENLGAARQVTVAAKDGSVRKIQAETLLVALGRTANVSGLGLEQAGVVFDHKGIKVDSRLRTNHKHMYAAGDVVGTFQFTHAAGYEGGIVVSNAIFHLPRKADYTWMPWCTYADPELAGIGMNEKAAAAAGINYTVWRESFADNDRSIAEGNPTGGIKMLLDEKEKPLGIQIFGPRAGDLLGEWVAVVNGGVKLATLAGAVHPYPTLGEINKRVVGSFLASKIFSETVKKGLKFIFNLKGRACDVDLLE